MTIEEISKLKNYNTRLTTVLNELENLEDGLDCDYSYCVVCLQQATQQLERRRENLQRRGRTLNDETEDCRWCNKDGECVLFEVICDGYCGVKS